MALRVSRSRRSQCRDALIEPLTIETLDPLRLVGTEIERPCDLLRVREQLFAQLAIQQNPADELDQLAAG